MKIAQMLIQPVQAIRIVEAEDLDETTRSDSGFGSTGLY
jgi:dUTP pyrophosphatase